MTRGGADSKGFEVRGGDWTRSVRDERDLWLNNGINNSSLAIKLVSDGLLLVVVHPLGGRQGDNFATWIHVPAKMKISGQELLNVVDRIRSLYGGDNSLLNEQTFSTDQILSREYAERKYNREVWPSHGQNLAYIVTSPSLNTIDILSNPLQREFSKYKFVFVYEGEVKTSPQAVDISGIKFENLLTIPPLTENDLEPFTGKGEIMVQVDGKSFDCPINSKFNEKKQLTLTKKGCEPETRWAFAYEDEQPLQISGDKIQWRCKIVTRNITVVDADTNRMVYNAVITPNSRSYTRNDLTLPENEISNAECTISADGYNSATETIDLSGRTAQTVKLKRAKEHKNLIYKGRNGQIKVSFSGPGVARFCPLDGYGYNHDGSQLLKLQQAEGGDGQRREEYVSNDARDHKDRGLDWLSVLVGFVAALAIGAAVWGGMKVFGNEKAETVDPQPKPIENVTGETTDLSGEATVSDEEYKKIRELLNGDKWKRDEIEAHQAIKGLWDEMNSFNYDAILNRANRYPKLRESNNFTLLEDKVKELKAVNNRRSDKFCNEGDHEITIGRYINTLDRTLHPEQAISNEVRPAKPAPVTPVTGGTGGKKSDPKKIKPGEGGNKDKKHGRE